MQSSEEQHPHFPSGEWQGFYNYKVIPTWKDTMNCNLTFKNGVVTGAGGDSVGDFTWKGTYDTNSGSCIMMKSYIGQHQVHYNGHADENGIWGTWEIVNEGSGGFHIWPKDTNGTATTAEEDVEELLMNIVREMEVVH